MWSVQAALAAVAAVILTVAFGQRVLRPTLGPRDPPVLHPRIPFIGHLIGLLLHGNKYYSITSARCRHPLYMLPMPGMNTYIATSPALASHIQRASSTLSFESIVIPVSSRMVGLSKATVALLYDVNAENEGRTPFMTHMHNYLYTLMSPAEIKTQGSIVLEQLSQHINSLPNVVEHNLFQWSSELFTQATTTAFYGPDHIFAENPSLVEDFWTWEDGLIGLIASPLPQLTSRKSFLACERMVAALTNYLKQNRQEKASAVIRERIRWHTERNMCLDDKARCEVVMLFGALLNAGLTVFWMLNYVFSDERLLEDLRQEIEKTSFSVDETSKIATVNYKALQASCPLLNSVFKETMRLVAPMASTRIVTKDTLIADTYLLRANSIVMIPGSVIHGDPAVWGPDASFFNPRRFFSSVHGTKTGIKEKEKSAVHPAAWRAFGGGAVFCPGRHFAQIEILALVATVVMGWDFRPIRGQHKVEFNPPKDDKRIPLGVMKPLCDITVSMERRKGMKNLKWVMKLE